MVAMTVEVESRSPSLACNLMVPVRGALMADSIFMASTVAMASPSVTESPSATFQATRLASKGEVTAPSGLCALSVLMRGRWAVVVVDPVSKHPELVARQRRFFHHVAVEGQHGAYAFYVEFAQGTLSAA